MIERRDLKRRQSEGERLEEALWKSSERRHAAQLREQRRWEWCRYFDRLARGGGGGVVGVGANPAAPIRRECKASGHPERATIDGALSSTTGPGRPAELGGTR